MDKWQGGSDIQAKVKSLIGSAHPHLIDISDEIVVIFKEKASMKGKLPILGKTSKAPAILSVLGSKDWKFILEIPHDEWEGLADDQQEALLDHLLCYISGEEDEKSGDMKYSLTSPDISYFSEEVSRRGHWRPNFLGAPEEESTDDSGLADLLEDFDA